MTPSKVLVWDPLVRVFHWSLVICFALAYWAGETRYDLHRATGYGVLALVLVRILWGFVGTRHARFRDFIVGPGALGDHLLAMLRGRVPRLLGHNPAGGVMILLLLAVLLTIALSGVMLDAAENRTGPLGGTRLFLYTDIVEEVHVIATNVSLALVLTHLIGVAYMSILHRENLVRAMIDGRKRTDS